MAHSLVMHGGPVFQFKSHAWKESWLCLEDTGRLLWKRKDAYQIKGEAHLKDCIDKICIPSPNEKHLANASKKPFLFSVPLKCDDHKVTTKIFAVFSREDLELWLDAFATSVGEWKVFKAVREQHKARVAEAREMDEDTLEDHLTCQEFVPYLRTIWSEYVAQRHNSLALQEITIMPKKRPSVVDLFSYGSPSSPINNINKSWSCNNLHSPVSYHSHHSHHSHHTESDYVTTSDEEEIVVI